MSSALGVLLGGPFQFGNGGPGGWLVLDEPELHIVSEIVVPDLGGWRRERLPQVPNAAFFSLAPDWICEVLSQSTAAVDRADKLPIYARAGVQHAWLVSPILRTLEMLRAHEGGWLLVGTYRDGARVRAEPFNAIELDLSMLWASMAPPPPRGTRASEAAGEYGLETL